MKESQLIGNILNLMADEGDGVELDPLQAAKLELAANRHRGTSSAPPIMPDPATGTRLIF